MRSLSLLAFFALFILVLSNIVLATDGTVNQESNEEKSGGKKESVGVNSVVLTGENFTQTVASGESFIMFYAPWCGFCKDLKPMWEELANVAHVEGLGTRIAKVDIDQDAGLGAQFEVKGIPTLIHIHDGVFRVYKGENSIKDFKEFITSGWKERKETGKVPTQIPAWYRFQIEMYNKLMSSLSKLEDFATTEIHEEPMVAGLVVGLGVAGALVLAIFLISNCHKIFHRRTPVAAGRLKTD